MITNFDLLYESIGSKLAKTAGIVGGGLIGLDMQRSSKARDRLAKYRKTNKEADELNKKCPK